MVSTAAFHARVRGSVPGLGGLKETKLFLPHPRVKVSIVGSLRDREVACSASDRQGSNFEFCVWRTVSSQSSHHPQEVLLAQFSLYVHKGGLKPDSFHFVSTNRRHQRKQKKDKYIMTQYQIVRSLCLVVCVYCLSWAPYAVITLIAHYGNPQYISQAISALAIILAKASTVANPVILVVLHPNMKRVAKQCFLSFAIVSISSSSWRTPTSQDDAVQQRNSMLESFSPT